MIQSISYKGRWHIPGVDEWYSGTLAFDPMNGCELEIVGQFQPQGFYRPIPILLGSTSEGWITLLNTRRNQGQYSNVTQTGTSVYKPSFIFVNHCFDSIESIAFRSVKFSLFNLLEWLEPKGIEEEWPEKGYVLKYTRPQPIEFSCYNGCRGSIEYSLKGSRRNEQYDIQVSQHADIRLNYDQKKAYSNILSDIFVLVKLLTFCTYEQSYPITIEFSDDDLTDEFVEEKLKHKIPMEIQCFYLNTFYKPSYSRRKWHQHLLRYELLGGKFPSVVPLWFTQAEQLGHLIDLILRFFVNQYDFSIERFIEMAKAVEVFHRVQYGYKKTLRDRFADIVRDYAFSYFDQRVTDREVFCSQAADSRHYYTHYDARLKDRALKGKQLFDLTENLKLLLIAGILKILDVPISAIEESVQRVIY